MLVKMQVPRPSPDLSNQCIWGGAQMGVCSPSFLSDSATCPSLGIMGWSKMEEGGSSGRLDSDLKRQVKAGYTVSGRQGDW